MKNFFKLMVGVILPILGFLIGWWGSLPFVSADKIWIFALVGFVFGVILNFIFAQKVFDIYKIKPVFLVLIYLFYTIGVFGFFMGVPLFNLFLGPIAGAYMAMRYRENKWKIEKNSSHNIAHFTTDILILICIFSGYLALADSSTAANLEGMFNLNFSVTKTMIWTIVLAGGLVLISTNYLLTRYVYKKVARI